MTSPGSRQDIQPPASATALLDGIKLLVPLAGLVDVAAERERLEKNRQKLAADLERVPPFSLIAAARGPSPAAQAPR
ncbi:MAG: hypothetical protein JJT85_07000 [Chromatiales bacterium]|nr:hypothetical protein [Chromatiales bacterium]